MHHKPAVIHAPNAKNRFWLWAAIAAVVIVFAAICRLYFLVHPKHSGAFAVMIGFWVSCALIVFAVKSPKRSH